MKKIYTLSFAALCFSFSQSLSAQYYCGSDRYDKEVFSNFVKTSNVTYGQSVTYSGSTQVQKMDIYEPNADTAIMRPLIIWAHGGSFIGGSATDIDVVTLSQKFAKRGYVTASINYRLGIFPVDSIHAKQAVLRAVQDMKAAVRFFRKDAYTTNTYKIDTNNIIVGGSSAGAFMALHYAFLDTDSELVANIDTNGVGLSGGLEGNSGNPGYSSQIRAAINLCGALGSATYLDNGYNEPFVSMHGTADGTVPYGTAMVSVSGFQIMVVDGSYTIKQQTDAVGVMNPMYTWNGADHVPYAGTSASNVAYMDTTERFVGNFLYQVLACTPSDPNPLPNTFTTGVNENIVSANAISVYPNPASENIFIRFNDVAQNNYQLTITDLSGRIVKKDRAGNTGSASFSVKELSRGIYFLKIADGKTETVKKIVVM